MVMSKTQQLTRARNAREKLAAQRAADRRAQRRRKILITAGSIAVVFALLITFAAIKLTESPAQAGKAVTNGAVARQITSIPAGTYDRVGAGTATGLRTVGG